MSFWITKNTQSKIYCKKCDSQIKEQITENGESERWWCPKCEESVVDAYANYGLPDKQSN